MITAVLVEIDNLIDVILVGNVLGVDRNEYLRQPSINNLSAEFRSKQCPIRGGINIIKPVLTPGIGYDNREIRIQQGFTILI